MGRRAMKHLLLGLSLLAACGAPQAPRLLTEHDDRCARIVDEWSCWDTAGACRWDSDVERCKVRPATNTW